MIGLKGCPACPLVQSYTWIIFIGVMLLGWERSIGKIIDRMNDETEAASVGGTPLRRTFLIALVFYALVAVWFKMIVLMIFGYVLCSLVAMTAHYALSVTIEKALVWLSNPAYIFDSVSTAHVPFHAVVGLGAAASASVSILLYIRNNDLQNQEALRAKMLRVLLCMPSFMFSCYVVYGMYSFVMSV
jgi:hypothetical protein